MLGHFEKNDHDVKSYDDTIWLTLTEIEQAEAMSDEDLEAQLL